MKTNARILMLGAFAASFLLLTPNAAKANGYQGTINSAETHTGLSITSASGFDTWTFTANKGDRIIINAVKTSGSLDTTIILYNPHGTIEASTAGYNGGGDELDWQLQTNGLYTIVIEDYNLTATGTYDISFLDIAGAITSSSNPYGGQISSAETTNGNINVASDMNAFQFYGNAGERIILNAVTTSGSLDTTIVLYPPTGSSAEVSTAGYNGGGDELDWQLQTNGLYTVIIRDYGLTSTGAYNLTLFTINGALTSSSNPYGGQIVPAQTTNGNINVKSDMNAFQFYGNAGERIILNAVTTSGSLDTTIVLYPPTGSSAEASTAGYNGGGDKLDYQLMTNGLYTVFIRDYGLTSTGAYNLTYFKIPGALTSISNPYGGIIVPSQTTGGFIQSRSDMNEFQFYGSVGQQIIINAVTTNGPLDTTINLYPPTGNTAETSTAGYNGGGDQLNWNLLTNGLYCVFIQDYGLTSTGKYTLSFSTIPPITNPGLYNPSPSLGQMLTSLPASLSWSAVSGATNYNLYFGLGVTNALQQTGTNVATASFAFPSVATQTVYYWQVVANTPSGSIQGPYWWFNVLSTNPPPVVAVGSAGGNQLMLSWPALYSSFALQTTTNLTTGNWITVTNPYITIGTNFVVTNNMAGNSGFYRLVQ
jgi:hypothetical protein